MSMSLWNLDKAYRVLSHPASEVGFAGRRMTSQKFVEMFAFFVSVRVYLSSDGSWR